MGKEKGSACPCCEGSIEDFPDQDGACDYYCTHCGWHEREPSSENLAAALTLREARQADKPTIVLFVEGGVVQGVEGNGPVRVILCDFDCTDAPGTVGGRPCHVGVWDSPEEPSEEFNEVLRLAARSEDPSSPGSIHSKHTEKERGADMS